MDKFKSPPLIIGLLVAANIFIWASLVSGTPNKNTELYFLDAGQGDSELVRLPGNVKILIDGGPNAKVLTALSKSLPPNDRYIDLIILSHAEADHFTGLIEVAKRYKVGAFIYNGLDGKGNAWPELLKILKNGNAPVITLSAKDKIKYQDSRIDFIWPEKNNLPNITKSLNETALVSILQSSGAKALFTGDIGFKTENQLLEKYNLDADILKVSHHGSKYSTSRKFLDEVTPKISAIEVGKNSYGHPTAQVLQNLASVSSQIFRADRDGTVKLIIEDGKIRIFKQK